MKCKRKGKIFITLGVILIAAALALVGYNLIREKQAATSASYALEKLKSEIGISDLSSDSSSPSKNGEINDYAGNISAVSEEDEIPDYILNPTMDMPEKNLDGQDYIGILEIPQLGLSLPIISSWSETALNVAPCRYVGSAYTDDLIIAGHNYVAHFAYLSNLTEGSAVYFTDVDGNCFEYRVVLTEALHGSAVEEMKSGDWDLSLFTCTISGSYRTTVRCERVK